MIYLSFTDCQATSHHMIIIMLVSYIKCCVPVCTAVRVLHKVVLCLRRWTTGRWKYLVLYKMLEKTVSVNKHSEMYLIICLVLHW